MSQFVGVAKTKDSGMGGEAKGFTTKADAVKWVKEREKDTDSTLHCIVPEKYEDVNGQPSYCAESEDKTEFVAVYLVRI